MKQAVSVIIAAFNEERTLRTIVEVLRSWKGAREIIVVDDGSTDGTFRSIREFTDDITVIRHKTNTGKASAIADGIEKSTGDVILLIDADLTGLTHKDLDQLVKPVLSGKFQMALGASRFWSAGSFEPFTQLTGQRAMRRDIVAPEVDRMRTLGYGLELFFNKLFEPYAVATVKQQYVFVLGKLDKQSKPDAVVSYIKEIKDMLVQLVTQYSDEIGPHAKRIFEAVIRYIAKILSILMEQR